MRPRRGHTSAASARRSSLSLTAGGRNGLVAAGQDRLPDRLIVSFCLDVTRNNRFFIGQHGSSPYRRSHPHRQLQSLRSRSAQGDVDDRFRSRFFAAGLPRISSMAASNQGRQASARPQAASSAFSAA